jgi:hypothetical protein
MRVDQFSIQSTTARRVNILEIQHRKKVKHGINCSEVVSTHDCSKVDFVNFNSGLNLDLDIKDAECIADKTFRWLDNDQRYFVGYVFASSYAQLRT